MPPWWTTWAVDVSGLSFLCGLTILYLVGASRRRVHRRERSRATASFLAGCGFAVLALAGPIPAGSAQLLWVHMVQHLLFTVVAAPLIAFGEPATTVRVGLPSDLRHLAARLARATRSRERRIGGPPRLILAACAHIAALWIWHTPAIYDAADRSAAAHLLEHASFLGTAVWFWTAVCATARRHTEQQGLATLCLGAMIVQGGVLGALLAFAPGPLYAAYQGADGLSPLEDQQLAGALMWVLPGFLYAGIAIKRFIGWFESTEQRLVARDAREGLGG